MGNGKKEIEEETPLSQADFAVYNHMQEHMVCIWYLD